MHTFSRAGLGVLMILAIATGVWLNNTTWHNRRVIWQVHTAIIAGGVVGFMTDRITTGHE